MKKYANTIQKEIIDFLESKNHYATNIEKTSKRGESDILACINSRFFAIEVKTTDKMSYNQFAKRQQILDAGGYYLVIHSLSEFKLLYNAYINNDLYALKVHIDYYTDIFEIFKGNPINF